MRKFPLSHLQVARVLFALCSFFFFLIYVPTILSESLALATFPCFPAFLPRPSPTPFCARRAVYLFTTKSGNKVKFEMC